MATHESGEMRAMRMLAKHGRCVVSGATSEPGELATSRKNLDYPTVASAAMDVIDVFNRRGEPRVAVEKAGSRKWASLTDAGRQWCRDNGIEVAGETKP